MCSQVFTPFLQAHQSELRELIRGLPDVAKSLQDVDVSRLNACSWSV